MGIVHDERHSREQAAATAGREPLTRDEFAALAADHRPRAVRFAIAFLHDNHLAEDMVQEGLRRLFEARERYPLRTLFGPHLVKTVARLCIDCRRSRGAESRRIARLEPRTAAEPSLPLERSEADARVATAVAELPERERACFLLTVCEGLSYHDAADALGLSFAQVNNAIHRARATLRRTLAFLVAEEGRDR